MRTLYASDTALVRHFLLLSAFFLTLGLTGCSDIPGTKAILQRIDPVEELAYPSSAVVRNGPAVSLLRHTEDTGFPLAELTSRTVVQVSAYTRPDTGTSLDRSWCLLTTRSGREGWAACNRLRFITDEEAEEIVLRDQQEFESRVRRSILSAAEAAIEDSRVHPLPNLRQIWIAEPLSTAASTSQAETTVSALMLGKYIQFNKYQVDVRVSLYLDLDRDRLSRSTVEVQSAEVVGNQRVSGVGTEHVVELFSLLAL